ncbi:uncharacterized protein LOC133910292 [Phragmites australis]|uniref:uncharacterized protein LOC133910292 n=1 Tax=Phragmites australis TaxID=29695 RepID=UPI002D79B073|nr:uncharacterized protein LOC133910292 [Phragmites australis]
MPRSPGGRSSQRLTAADANPTPERPPAQGAPASTGEVARESGSGTFLYLQLMVTNYTSWEAVEPVASATVDEKKYKKARLDLFQALPEDLLMQVARKKTAKEEGESPDQYVGRLNSMSVRYVNLGETLDDAALVKKLFDTMPDRFLSVITEIEQFYDLDKKPFEEAVGRLKAFEERTRPRASDGNSISDSQLLFTQAEWQSRQKKDGGNSSSSNKGKSHLATDSSNHGQGGRGRGRGCGRGGRGRMSRNDEESGSDGGRRNKSHIKCFNCYKIGRYVNECKAPKKKKEETHLTHADYTELALLLVVLEEAAQELQHQRGAVLLNEEKLKPELHDTTAGGSSSEVWYLDNRVSNHVTGDKEKFRELDKGIIGKVKFGDGSTSGCCRRSTTFQDCAATSSALDNLPSPAQLLMKVRRTQNCLYKIELHQATSVCLLTILQDPVWLWHARIGYVNFIDMKLLVDKGMTIGVPPITHPNQLCQRCLLAKQWMWVFVIKSKNQACSMFRKFKL